MGLGHVKNVTFRRKRDHSLPSVGLKTKVMVHFVSHKHCPFRSTIKEALLGHKCPITLCHFGNLLNRAHIDLIKNYRGFV